MTTTIDNELALANINNILNMIRKDHKSFDKCIKDDFLTVVTRLATLKNTVFFGTIKNTNWLFEGINVSQATRYRIKQLLTKYHIWSDICIDFKNRLKWIIGKESRRYRLNHTILDNFKAMPLYEEEAIKQDLLRMSQIQEQDPVKSKIQYRSNREDIIPFKILKEGNPVEIIEQFARYRQDQLIKNKQFKPVGFHKDADKRVAKKLENLEYHNGAVCTFDWNIFYDGTTLNKERYLGFIEAVKSKISDLPDEFKVMINENNKVLPASFQNTFMTYITIQFSETKIMFKVFRRSYSAYCNTKKDTREEIDKELLKIDTPLNTMDVKSMVPAVNRLLNTGEWIKDNQDLKRDILDLAGSDWTIEEIKPLVFRFMFEKSFGCFWAHYAWANYYSNREFPPKDYMKREKERFKTLYESTISVVGRTHKTANFYFESLIEEGACKILRDKGYQVFHLYDELKSDAPILIMKEAIRQAALRIYEIVQHNKILQKELSL